MKTLARIFSIFSAGFSLLALTRTPERLSFKLIGLKLLAGGFSPFLILAGAVGTLLGLKQGDRLATRAGMLGTSLALHHLTRVTRSNHAIQDTFGQDWDRKISPELRSKFNQRRYTPFPSRPAPIACEHDLVFATHHETGAPLLADLWQPAPGVKQSGLGIIYLHGSGWHYLDKGYHTRHIFQYLAGQGHVILDVAYTLAPAAQLPAMLADVRRAIIWMKNKPGINPERVVLMGGSAGAHLALLSAYTSDLPIYQTPDTNGCDTSVRGVVSYYGVIDLVSEHKRLLHIPLGGATWQRLLTHLEVLIPGKQVFTPAELLPSLMGGSPDQVPELYRQGSPITHVGPHCPPTLLLAGEHDFAVDIDQDRRLHTALKAAGAQTVFIKLPYTEHVFDLFFPPWSPAYQTALYDVERFLALLV